MSMRSCPRTVSRVLLAVMGFFAVLAAFALPAAAAKVTSPKEQFGFAIGDDYQLVNYKQLTAYWKKLDAESDRMKLVEIGKTAEGRTMLMAIVTSPANHARLARIKDTARRLALAEGLTDAGARTLAAGGKAVVWIDGGLHATEILGSQQLVELVWRMVSRDDAETRRILDDVVLLAVPANPDGLDLVADWYMREKEPSKRSMNGVPVLYQKYIGHDNNRDFYMNTQAETKAMSRQLYIEWHPQILYNHHQTGPAGTVLFAPPFRDPFNYAFDPLIPVGLDLVSASMHNRFVTEDKPGATMRSGAGYSTWWNGGLRSTGYFHNVIGILTEAIGNPTPIDIPFIPERLLPKHDYPYPVAPQKWHFRQSVEYAITADMAILDVASKHREDFLYRRYLMGRHAIELGSKDSWTVVPGTIAEVRAAVERDSKSAGGTAQAQAPGQAGPGGGFGRARGVDKKYYDGIFDKAKRDPRGYIIPSDQADFPTAVKFVNALLESGIAVERAKADFEVAGRRYPKDSFVVLTAQAFRPHVMTMFEPQDHPNDIPYPGGAPNPPYDAAGWTLAYQMGVAFDRVLDAFGGPFERVPGVTKPPAGAFDAGDGRGRLSPRPSGQRFVHRRQPAPQGRREGPVAEVRRILGPGLDGRGGHPPESGEGAGVEHRRRGGRAEGRGVRAEAASHRAVGFVRRLDGLRLDPLAPRAVRIPLRARLRSGARCGWPRIPVRRAHPRRRLRPPRPGRRDRKARPAASGIFRCRRRPTSPKSTGTGSAGSPRRRPSRSSGSSWRPAGRSWPWIRPPSWPSTSSCRS